MCGRRATVLVHMGKAPARTLEVEGTILCGRRPAGVARPAAHHTKKQTNTQSRHSSPWSVFS